MAMRPKTPDATFMKVKPKSPGQQEVWKALRDDSINYIVISGPAGTGKSFLSCYYAMEQYMAQKYRKIYIARSVTPIKSEEIGFLKGDEKAKLSGYMVPMIENFEKFMPDTRTLEKAVEMVPLVQVRGRSIEGSILLCDEFQNLSLDVLKALITRINHSSKLVLMGDLHQNDTRKEVTDAQVFCEALEDMDSFAWIELTDADQQRNSNITEILKRLDNIPRCSSRNQYR